MSDIMSIFLAFSFSMFLTAIVLVNVYFYIQKSKEKDIITKLILQVEKLEIERSYFKNKLIESTRDLRSILKDNIALKEYLKEHKSHKVSSQFSKEELRFIRSSCHPDRHNNSDRSNELTKKLNSIINQS